MSVALLLALVPAGVAPPSARAVLAAQVTPAAPAAQVTPVAQRTTVLGVLDKRTGRAETLTMKPGETRSWGPLTIALKTCETTPPWEARPQTGAFVQVSERPVSGPARRVFSGWLFAESPSLNPMQHPVYDVWLRSCAMTFPGGTPAAASKPSSAKKSAGADTAPAN